ncbi:MAG: DUF3365 domain-containing protein, partial [Phycisphaeraceae bacterium]
MQALIRKFTSLSLGIRIIALTLAVITVIVVVNNIVFAKKAHEIANDAMNNKAAAFTAVADAAKNHTAKLQSDGDFDNEMLLKELAEQRAAAEAAGTKFDYTQARIFKTIPVVAGWYSAAEAAERENINSQITSFDARNPENEPDAREGDEDFHSRGPFVAELLTDLEQGFAGGEETISRIDPATNTLHYMRAIKLSQDCMLCHGHPDSSPTGDGKDVLGYTMENWTPGDMHGAYHVMMPLAPVDKQLREATMSVLYFVVPIVIGAVVLFIFALRFMFNKPIALLIARIRDIAEGEGDLTKRIEIKSDDEIGQLGTWFNAFVLKIHDTIVEVTMASSEVAAASTEIAASAEEIAAGASEQSQQITQVSSAVEEMSASVVEV